MCVNYKKLNTQTKRFDGPLPLPENLIETLCDVEMSLPGPCATRIVNSTLNFDVIQNLKTQIARE